MGYKGMFKCTVMSSKSLLFEGEIGSIFLTGDKGEYELLAYHFPILGILQRGNVIIDWKESISIKSGIVRFFANECVILIEEEEKTIDGAVSQQSSVNSHS